MGISCGCCVSFDRLRSLRPARAGTRARTVRAGRVSEREGDQPIRPTLRSAVRPAHAARGRSGGRARGRRRAVRCQSGASGPEQLYRCCRGPSDPVDGWASDSRPPGSVIVSPARVAPGEQVAAAHRRPTGRPGWGLTAGTVRGPHRGAAVDRGRGKSRPSHCLAAPLLYDCQCCAKCSTASSTCPG